MSGKTWAVVVNWNGGDANLECLRSLRGEGLAAERIVFVDNASTDGSPERVAAEHPGVRILRNARNEGFGHGTNRGVRLALDEGAGALFLVNNDVALAPGALARLEAELAADPAVGIVGPRIVLRDDPATIWAAGGRMTFRQNLSELLGHGRPDGPRWREDRDVDYVPGCALLVRREVLERVGLLEGDYFAYHEEVELCMRVREAGFRVRVAGEALALHDAHRSTGGGYNPLRKYMTGVNTVRFLRRHGTPARWLSFLVFEVATLPAAWLLHAPRGEGPAVVAKARGLLDGLRGRAVTEETLRRFS